jgi:diadenosine tetraphosphate (Ap4A) HIT family hydrolase
MADCPMCSKWESEPDMRITQLEQCYVSLNRDQFFRGYCFVYTKNHLTELFHLDLQTRSKVIEEMNSVAAALFRLFNPEKINYELLGNMVPHMHWHVVPRFATDHLWPRPVWSEPHEPVELTATEYSERIALIRQELRLP